MMKKIYHNALIHVPMSYNYQKENNVLVIGGGDGGAIRELLKYSTVKNIDLVEIDKEVIDVCVKQFPQIASGFQDNRVHVTIEDGYEYVNKYEKTKKYDLIVVDSTEQVKTNSTLDNEKFWRFAVSMLDEKK